MLVFEGSHSEALGKHSQALGKRSAMDVLMNSQIEESRCARPALTCAARESPRATFGAAYFIQSGGLRDGRTRVGAVGGIGADREAAVVLP